MFSWENLSDLLKTAGGFLFFLFLAHRRHMLTERASEIISLHSKIETVSSLATAFWLTASNSDDVRQIALIQAHLHAVSIESSRINAIYKIIPSDKLSVANASLLEIVMLDMETSPRPDLDRANKIARRCTKYISAVKFRIAKQTKIIDRLAMSFSKSSH